MPTEGFIERNKAICGMMNDLSKAVEFIDAPEGSEIWKYQRMSRPDKVWSDYGLSVNLNKLMAELSAPLKETKED